MLFDVKKNKKFMTDFLKLKDPSISISTFLHSLGMKSAIFIHHKDKMDMSIDDITKFKSIY